MAHFSDFKPPTNSTESRVCTGTGPGSGSGCVRAGSHLSGRPPHRHLLPGIRQLSQGHPVRTFLFLFRFSDSGSVVDTSPSLSPLFAGILIFLSSFFFFLKQMFKLVAVLFPPPLRWSFTRTEPESRSERTAERTPSNSGCVVARSPPLPPERRRAEAAERRRKRRIATPFSDYVWLKLSFQLPNMLLSSLRRSRSPPLPHFPNMAAGVGLPVNCVTAPACQGAGPPRGAQVDGSLRPPQSIAILTV